MERKRPMKASERVNRFVSGRRSKLYAEGPDNAVPRNVSGHIKDPEVAVYIGKLLDIIDELEERISKLENRPRIVSLPRGYAVNQ